MLLTKGGEGERALLLESLPVLDIKRKELTRKGL